MHMKRIVYASLCIMLCCGCKSGEILQNGNPSQEIGDSIQDIEMEDDYLKSVQYPHIGIETVDTRIKQVLLQYESSFMNKVEMQDQKQKPEWNVTYHSFVKDDRYISIQLSIYECFEQKHSYIETMVYDIKNEEFLTIEDIGDEKMTDELIDDIQLYFMKQDIDITVVSLTDFVLKKDSICFYFSDNHSESEYSFSIPYDQFDSYKKMEAEELQVYVPYDQVLNEPVKNIDPSRPMIALTFDDGPSKRYTGAILDALKENGANATFFILGSNADNAPALLQRMILEGNEIGNHTYSHKQLTTLSKENIEEEIEATQESIYEITHVYPTILRPPYGSKNDIVLKCAQGKRLVFWSLDTQDWKSRNVKGIVDYVLKTVKEGDIILMHDVYATTAQAAVILIPALQEKGYQLVTVSDLYTYQEEK